PVGTGEPLALGDGPGQEGVLPGGLPAARPEALVFDVVGAQRIAMAEHDAPAEGLQDDGFLAQLEAGPLRIALDDRRIGLATEQEVAIATDHADAHAVAGEPRERGGELLRGL